MKAPVTGGADGPPREIPPPGKYLGICNGVYMLGTQPGYQGGEPKQQVLISFELHKRKGPAKDGQGRPYEVGSICSFTANVKSKLIELAGALINHTYTEEDLEEIRSGGGFDAEPLLGKVCWIDLVHDKKADGTPRDKIKSATPIDPDDEAELAQAALDNSETDHAYWDWTMGTEAPGRIRYFWERAAENPDRKAEPAKLPGSKFSAPAMAAAGVADDDIPF